MPDSTPPSPSAVARILYKEVVKGDLRKFEAKSNDADTGGGARDLRFGDYQNIEPIVKRLFPSIQNVQRSRDGKSQTVQVFKGTFFWRNNRVHSQAVQFEPPTSARPTEGRLTRVHEQPALDPTSILPLHEDDRVFLLFVQLNDGRVWPYFATESSLRTSGLWDARVAGAMIKCIEARRPKSMAVIGYCDFTNGDGYCNGK